MRRLLGIFLCAAWAVLPAEIPSEWQTALDRVASDSLRGHLSFIASDLLEGRDTPSHGLDIAAEYIAAQFRGAGLEPVSGDGYFHTANWKLRRTGGLSLTFLSGEKIIRVAGSQMAGVLDRPFEFRDASVSVVEFARASPPKEEQIRGRVIAVVMPDAIPEDRDARNSAYRSYMRMSRKLEEWQPTLVLLVDPAGFAPGRRHLLIDPANPPAETAPRVTVTDPVVAEMLRQPAAEVRISLLCGEPVEEDVRLRNVVGILRGSDATLRETAVMVSAHYDHVGVKPPGEGDRIFNGANDNGSGTVVVIELARALASLKTRPKRSLLFVAFFGEERGFLGSRYYAANPPFPLESTVAGLNLEQVGRTDSSEGPQIKRLSVTGFDFSDVGELLRQAGQTTGVEVYKHKRYSEDYFRASDNLPLAEKGVPAHSLTVAFQYPDYHGVADHWNKIDFTNMATVTRTIGLGMLLIANREQPPQWNPANPHTNRYRTP